MTPEEIEQLYKLQKLAERSQLSEVDARELIRLRRNFRKETEQVNALARFNAASRVWRVSFPGVEDDMFPFYALRRLNAEREMKYWGLGDHLILEEIDRAEILHAVYYEPSCDCYHVTVDKAGRPTIAFARLDPVAGGDT